MGQKDSDSHKADQDGRSRPTVVLFRRTSPLRRVKTDDEYPPDPDDFDPGPAAA
jgi:hypothetical protein